jgi:hypothetical protein
MTKFLFLAFSAFILTSAAFAEEKQCINNFCVGDSVIPDNAVSGSAPVLAINAEKNQCVLNKARIGTSAYFVRCDQLSVKKGCLNDICVGDKVIPYNATSGSAVINAINFVKGRYTVNLKWIGSKWLRYKADQLTVIKRNEKARM